jgi:hypothetical protein
VEDRQIGFEAEYRGIELHLSLLGAVGGEEASRDRWLLGLEI